MLESNTLLTAAMEGAHAHAHDRLTFAASAALGDLLVPRGDDAVAVAGLLISLDPRSMAWFAATAHASRPLRVVAVANYLLLRVIWSGCACLGVTAATLLPADSPVLALWDRVRALAASACQSVSLPLAVAPCSL